MKKFSTLLFFFITLLFSSASMAQSSDYFVGDWEVQIKDTPMGTISVVLTLERADGKLVGKFVDKASGVETKMNQITEQGTGLTLSFTAEGYGDLYLTLQRADDENVTGSLMDSFAVEGKRVAQKSDYFVGAWDVQIKDTPMGTIFVSVLAALSTNFPTNLPATRSRVRRTEMVPIGVSLICTFHSPTK